jgi:hypothetical protein
MKFLILSVDRLPTAVLFGENIPHKNMTGGYEVLGAGFTNSDQSKVWGESEGLGICSHPNDLLILKLTKNSTVQIEPKKNL